MNIAATVKPGSKQPGIALDGNSLVLRVRERAAEGAANEACIRALAKALGIASARVSLVRGARSRAKIFRIDGIEESEARKRLGLSAS